MIPKVNLIVDDFSYELDPTELRALLVMISDVSHTGAFYKLVSFRKFARFVCERYSPNCLIGVSQSGELRRKPHGLGRINTKRAAATKDAKHSDSLPEVGQISF